MDWYTLSKMKTSGYSAEVFSAELSRFKMKKLAAADRHRLKKIILSLIIGGMAGWGLNELVSEISQKTGLPESEAIELVEEVAQESVPARRALQEAEAAAAETPDAPTGYDMDAFFRTIEGYEGSEKRIYRDDANNRNPTIGIGHLVTPQDNFDENTVLTPEQIRALFEQDVQKHLRRAERLIPQFPNFPTYLQQELLASVYRGGISGSPNAVRLINAGKWREAAAEFLNHAEYRRRKRSGGDGVTRRMENLRNALLRYSDEQR